MNIVITGSNGGIGRLLSNHFIEKNHNVCKISRSKQDGFSFECDISDIYSLQKCVKFISKQWNRVDCLICCAGIQDPIGPAMLSNPLKWANNINVNLIGTYYTIHSFYKLLNKSKVICFSGGGSTSSRPNFSSYSVSKTGILRLVEILSDEFYGNIEINAIAPGAIYTNMTKQILLNNKLAGKKEWEIANRLSKNNDEKIKKVIKLIEFLMETDGISGKIISAQWDNLDEIKKNKENIQNTDIYTLRRILPNDRNKVI
jgi:NAD(P)-dependent dehydrogenase (short-subunit alcohol dehydrogenase family)